MDQAKYGRFTTGTVIAVAFVVAVSLCTFSGAITPALAQGPAGQQQMQQGGAPPAGAPGARGAGARGQGRARGGGGMRGPAALVVDDYEGFEQIFDGTMNNWDGDPSFWRVEEDMIIGESTPENPVKQNTFIIWRGGEPGDFELKIQYRMNSTNSGIQYRSEAKPDRGQWSLGGYQADIDFTHRFAGMMYIEQGRGIVCLRGQICRLEADKQPQVIGNLENNEALAGYIKINDWNQYHIIARGNTMTHIVNGHVTTVVIDDDVENRKMNGLIGVQIHVGAPMKLELRNIYLKNL